MKKLNRFFIMILCFFSYQICFGQIVSKADTTNFRYYDYSNGNWKPSNILYLDYLAQLEKTLIIIDNKFYKLNSKEYTELNKDSILNMEIIKDDNSESPIKIVIIITTK